MSRAQLLQRVPFLKQRPVLSVLLLVVVVVVSMCCGHRVGKHLRTWWKSQEDRLLMTWQNQ